MVMPISGRCDCASPARCPRVDLCATELVVDLLVADPAPFISRCDVTLRCERPELGAASQCPGPCPVDDRVPTPAAEVQHWRCGTAHDRELPCP